MTLGALGGALRPLTRAELLALPPVVNLVKLGQAFGVSEPVIRERVRRKEIEALGIRVLKLGQQNRVPTEDILRVLGITRENGEAGPAPPDPAATPTAASAPLPHEDTKAIHEHTSGRRI
jgi:hypothetical protein